MHRRISELSEEGRVKTKQHKKLTQLVQTYCVFSGFGRIFTDGQWQGQKTEIGGNQNAVHLGSSWSPPTPLQHRL